MQMITTAIFTLGFDPFLLRPYFDIQFLVSPRLWEWVSLQAAQYVSIIITTWPSAVPPKVAPLKYCQVKCLHWLQLK